MGKGLASELLLAGLDAFLTEQPLMALQPLTATDLVEVAGTYRLDAAHDTGGRLTRDFKIQIFVPASFPEALPSVFEAGDIPRIPDFHVNHDGSLCLGSPFRLRETLYKSGGFDAFSSECLRPYLYAVTKKLRDGGPFVFGELKHGAIGILEDLAVRLRIPVQGAKYALELLTMKRKPANKSKCPCGCGNKLVLCDTHTRLREIGRIARRSWFKRQKQDLFGR